jgi:hypothetical protein
LFQTLPFPADVSAILTIPDISIALRAVAVYAFIILAIRLFGKKELSQLSVVGPGFYPAYQQCRTECHGWPRHFADRRITGGYRFISG